jgi:hypothetical protein
MIIQLNEMSLKVSSRSRKNTIFGEKTIFSVFEV